MATAPIRVGDLRHRVALSRSADNPAPAYVPAEVWAQIVSSEASQEDERRRVMRVRIRFHAQVTLDTIVTYQQRQFHVVGINHVDEGRTVLELLCHEVLNP